MDCHEIQDDLELHALGARTPARQQAVEAHLAACSTCRQVAEDYAALTDGLARRKAPQDSLALQRKIKLAVRSELRAANRRRVLRPVMWSGAAAAACLLIATAVSIWPRGSVPITGSQHRPVERVEIAPAQLPTLSAVVDSAAADSALGGRGGLKHWRLNADTLGCLSADRRRVFTLVRSGPARIALAALQGQTGRPLWQYAMESLGSRTRLCRPVALPGGRVSWTHGSDIHMLDASSGKLLWRYLGDRTSPLSAVAIDGERLIAASCSAVVELDVRTGRELSRHSLPKDVVGSGRPQVAFLNGQAIVVQTRSIGLGSVLCMDIGSGQVRWTRTHSGIYDVLASSAGLFVRAQGVHRLDESTGKVLWTRSAGGCGALTLADGVLNLVAADGKQTRLLALDPQTGQEVWSAPSMPSCEAFVRVDGAGYLRTLDGTIHMLSLGRI